MKSISPWRKVLSWEVSPSPKKIKKYLIEPMTVAAEYADSEFEGTIKWTLDDNNVVIAIPWNGDENPGVNPKFKYKIQDAGEYNGNNMISVQELWRGGRKFHITAIPSHLVAIMHAD